MWRTPGEMVPAFGTKNATQGNPNMRPTLIRFIITCLILCMPSLTEAQLRGVPTENIDPNAHACTDFDAYANGHWRVVHPMPTTESTWAIRRCTMEGVR